jgi:hypothetical protein
MGLTSEADLVDLRAMDTAEDVIVLFGGSSFNDGTTQTVLDPLGREM